MNYYRKIVINDFIEFETLNTGKFYKKKIYRKNVIIKNEFRKNDPFESRFL